MSLNLNVKIITPGLYLSTMSLESKLKRVIMLYSEKLIVLQKSYIFDSLNPPHDFNFQNIHYFDIFTDKISPVINWIDNDFNKFYDSKGLKLILDLVTKFRDYQLFIQENIEQMPGYFTLSNKIIENFLKLALYCDIAFNKIEELPLSH